MKTAVLFLALATSLFAQTASFPGSVVTNATMFRAANNVGTTLFAAQGATDTVAIVASSTGIVAPMLISVGTTKPEIEAVCAVSGNTLTIGYNGVCPSISGRGFDGTTAAAHAASVPVNVLVVAWLDNKKNVEIQAIEAALGPNLSNIPAGPAGPAGTNGAPGAAATIAVGTTVTLAPGNPATVNNSGSSGAATFNFGIPQGAVGPAGPLSTGYITPLIVGPTSSGTITGATHGVVSTGCPLVVAFRDNGSPQASFTGNYTIAPVTCDVSYSFASAQSNFYVVISNGGSGGSALSGLLSGTLASIPATCAPGDALYQATDQLITEQIYACTSTNTWTRAAYTQGATSSIPGSCTVGQIYFSTSATAGQNLYYCTSTNTWTQQSQSGLGGLNVSHLPKANSSTTIQDSNETDDGTTFTSTIAVSFGSATHTTPAKVGVAASRPGTCSVGEMYFATDATAGQNFYFCTAANTWTQQLNSGGGGGGGSSYCVGAGSGTAYTSTCSPAVTYTAGWIAGFTPNVDCTGGATTATFNGTSKSVKMANGSTDPYAGACTSNSLTVMQYDGTLWRIVGQFDVTHSGATLWQGFTSGGSGFASRDVGGTLITYYMPTTNGTTGQILTDSGSVSCDAKLPAYMPSTCHLLQWSTLASTVLFPVNPVTTTYSMVGSDFANCKTISTASASFTATLVASGSQPLTGQCVWVQNYGTGTVTVATNGQNLNGAGTSQKVPPGAQMFIVSDGTNYFGTVFSLSLPKITFTALSSAGVTNVTYLVTDCTTVLCSAGSGSTPVPAVYNGSAWQIMSGVYLTPPGATNAIPANGGAQNFVDSGCSAVAGVVTCGANLVMAGGKTATASVGSPTIRIDSTANIPTFTDASHSVIDAMMVVPKASRTANQFVVNIPSTGIQQVAAIAAADLPPLPFATPAASHTFSGVYDFFECSTTCTLTMPVPSAGVQYCARNVNNVATVITFAAIGSSARYEATAQTSYGTAGTGTFVSGGSVTDRVCFIGKDSTHYDLASFNGTWTAN